ncbi:MAG: Protein-arginine-phosphatase [Eubacteriales bacterium SKADARSKE-1]|nr:Protein-arginine-phosphatase [Eubacteriales bacterium SKADARSKE-1]
MKILFVCTGNTCRSPMAKELFKRFLKENDIKDITCNSAGVSGFNGEEASKNAIIACSDYDIDLKDHKSKNLSEIDINSIDLFVVMNFFQYDVLKILKIPADKIYVLGGGIEDPFGGDVKTYKKCCAKINSSLVSLYEHIKKQKGE